MHDISWHQTHTTRNMFDSYVYSFRFINLEKYLIILINNSSDSNYSLKFLILVVVTFTKKKKEKDKDSKKLNTQPSSEQCSSVRIILILCFV